MDLAVEAVSPTPGGHRPTTFPAPGRDLSRPPATTTNAREGDVHPSARLGRSVADDQLLRTESRRRRIRQGRSRRQNPIGGTSHAIATFRGDHARAPLPDST